MATTRAGAAAPSTSTVPPPVATPYANPFTSISHTIDNLDGSMATGKSSYVAWKFRILRILKENGLARALENAADNTDYDAADLPARERVNYQAFMIMSLTIRDSQIPHMQAARNAKEAWESLAKVHQGIGSNGRMVLMQKIWSLHLKEGQDMTAHVNSFKEVSTQLANLSPDRIGIADSDLDSMLSLSLPESYEPLIMAVQSRAEKITFDFLTGRLLEEATRRQVAQSSIVEQDPEPFSAFGAGDRFRVSSFRGREYSLLGNRGTGRSMHGGRSGGSKGRGMLQQPTVSGRCHYCNKESHWKNECFKRNNNSQQGNREGHLAFMGLANRATGSTEWIIDSGASKHLTAQKELLGNYITIPPTSITIGDGKEITAVGQGDISLHTV